MGFRNIDEGHLLENVIYLELLRRGHRVNIGKTGEYEVWKVLTIIMKK